MGMAELTQKDLREAVTGALEPFARSVQGEFTRIHGEFEKVHARMGTFEERMGAFEERMDTFDARLGNVERDVKWMRDNASELFAKLDRFITLLEKQEQETVILAAQVRRLEERVAKLESAKR